MATLYAMQSTGSGPHCREITSVHSSGGYIAVQALSGLACDRGYTSKRMEDYTVYTP